MPREIKEPWGPWKTIIEGWIVAHEPGIKIDYYERDEVIIVDHREIFTKNDRTCFNRISDRFQIRRRDTNKHPKYVKIVFTYLISDTPMASGKDLETFIRLGGTRMEEERMEFTYDVTRFSDKANELKEILEQNISKWCSILVELS